MNANRDNHNRPLDIREHACFIALLLLMGVVLFHWLGNSTATDVYGSSALAWVSRKWYEPNGTISHGWVIPLISAFFIYRRREAFRNAARARNWIGLLAVILCLALHWTGIRMQQSRLAILSLIGLTWAIPLYLTGWQVARLLIFPCSYLLLAMPWNFIDQLTVPLRIFSSVMSTHLLNGLGIAVVRQGTILVGTAHDFALNVADPCSGLRSLFAMLAIAAAYAQMLPWHTGKRWILFVLAIPIAVAANVIRITSITLIAVWFGGGQQLELYHDYSGYVLFPVAIVLLTMVASQLEKCPWGKAKP